MNSYKGLVKIVILLNKLVNFSIVRLTEIHPQIVEIRVTLSDRKPNIFHNNEARKI